MLPDGASGRGSGHETGGVKIAWRTFADLTSVCRANLDRVRALEPDIIVGIPRAGMVPATILASMLGLPLADLWSFCDRRSLRAGDVRAKHRAQCVAKRALLIDDASGYGRTMRAAVDQATSARPGVTLLPCAVYVDPDAVSQFSLAMEPLAKPRLFEWMWWRSGKLAHCCVDIDGVVCRDPTTDEKRDATVYRHFVDTVPPLYLPAKRVGAFVTGRSELYRAETAAWFARHGVTYGALVMNDCGPPPWRDKSLVGHADRKAAYYRKSDAVLFIESDERQAEMIARTARKPALCIATGRMW